jgi:hypothetical protein
MPGGPWRRVRVADVEIETPVDLASEASVEGGTAVLSGGGLTLIVDQGPFADRLTGYEDRAGFVRRREQIGGQPAELVTFRADDGTEVAAARLGDRLTAAVHGAPGTDPNVLTRMLRSIRTTESET